MNAFQEFISEMGKSERRELGNRLYRLLEHVLKARYIKDQIATDNLRGWNKSVRDQRRELVDLFTEHRHLKPEFTDELIDDVYRAVVADLQEEYPNVRFPRNRQLAMPEIMGKDVMAVLKR